MLKLADFGFARYLPASAMAETLCGSPLYMAPEILRYEKYDQKADLWSAGAVLFEMMYGKAPFRASNHVDLLRKIEQADNRIDFSSKVPLSSQMKDLIRKLLNKNPLERITYEGLAEHIVITGDIPGLVPEDRDMPQASASVRRSLESSSRQSSEHGIRQKPSQEDTHHTSRKPSDQDLKQRPEDIVRRKSSNGSQKQGEGVAVEMQRRPSQREQTDQRRPSIAAHQTAPGRQELLTGVGSGPSSAPRMERRPSRTSPLTNPPMVREPSTADPKRLVQDTALREARERTAQDMAFEKEYVMVEKRAVEINAFADEMDANRNNVQGALARRYTTQGRPAPAPGVEPSSPSRAMQAIAGRPQGTHQRAGSYERRYAPSPQSATNMLTKALNAANVRLFGALGTSPPFSKGASPPRGYGAFPVYPSPTPQAALLLGDGNESKTPVDEDTKIVRTMEDAGHRSEVIFGFAEVKYRQLLPATPSTQDALGIQQIGAQDKLTSSGGEEDKDMTTIATVTVAEEALVLYVKTLAILAKTIDLAGYWWNKQNRVEPLTTDAVSRPSNSNATEVGKRMNNVVQWARSRFNECLEKSEVVGRKLQSAQRELPLDHPGHPNNQRSASTSSGAVTTSAEHIQITSGVTAEKLMFERAVEMSRAAAVSELVGEELNDCEIGYVTAIMLLEAVLESDDEPLIRRPSAKKDKPADEVINGMETEDRQTVIKREHLNPPTAYDSANIVLTVIEGARVRLNTLRKKIQAAQQAAKRSSQSGGSGNITPKPSNNISPAPTPAVAGTPPK
jgi:serine/threonine-protein kinase ULK/ATG1